MVDIEHITSIVMIVGGFLIPIIWMVVNLKFWEGVLLLLVNIPFVLFKAIAKSAGSTPHEIYLFETDTRLILSIIAFIWFVTCAAALIIAVVKKRTRLGMVLGYLVPLFGPFIMLTRKSRSIIQMEEEAKRERWKEQAREKKEKEIQDLKIKASSYSGEVYEKFKKGDLVTWKEGMLDPTYKDFSTPFVVMRTQEVGDNKIACGCTGEDKDDFKMVDIDITRLTHFKDK